MAHRSGLPLHESWRADRMPDPVRARIGTLRLMLICIFQKEVYWNECIKDVCKHNKYCSRLSAKRAGKEKLNGGPT